MPCRVVRLLLGIPELTNRLLTVAGKNITVVGESIGERLAMCNWFYGRVTMPIAQLMVKTKPLPRSIGFETELNAESVLINWRCN